VRTRSRSGRASFTRGTHVRARVHTREDRERGGEGVVGAQPYPFHESRILGIFNYDRQYLVRNRCTLKTVRLNRTTRTRHVTIASHAAAGQVGEASCRR